MKFQIELSLCKLLQRGQSFWGTKLTITDLPYERGKYNTVILMSKLNF